MPIDTALFSPEIKKPEGQAGCASPSDAEIKNDQNFALTYVSLWNL
jgi:hypothetical protein